MSCLPFLFCPGTLTEDEGQDARVLITRNLKEGIRPADTQRLYKLAEDMKKEMIRDEARLVDSSGFAVCMRDDVFLSFIISLKILQNSQMEEVKAKPSRCSAAKSMINYLCACNPSRRVLYAWTLIKFKQDHQLKSISGVVKSRMELFKRDEIRKLARYMEDQGEEESTEHNIPYDDERPVPDSSAKLLHHLSEEAASRIAELCREWSRWATPRNELLVDAHTEWHRVDQSVYFRLIPIKCKNNVCIQSEYRATIELTTRDGQEYPLPEDLVDLLLPVLPNLHSKETITQVRLESTTTIVRAGRRRVKLKYKSITHLHNGSNFWFYVLMTTGAVVLIALGFGWWFWIPPIIV